MKPLSLLAFLLNLLMIVSSTERNPLRRNFFATDFLSDGEAEQRFFYNGIAAKETSAIYNDTNGEKHGAILRQMTDGTEIIQLIYDANKDLLDCDFTSDTDEMAKFFQSFITDYHSILSSHKNQYKFRNVTLRYIDSESDIPQDLTSLLRFGSLKKQCKKLHKSIKKQLRKKSKNSQNRRQKRELDDAFRVPHTKWCGRGNSATRPSQLGGYAAADRCCRQHDLHCPYSVTSLQEKYGLYNGRPYTVMHCACDDRFRSCLKQANTAASNLVGNLFFNILQTKCFVMKAEKVCKKTSWWGRCESYEMKKRAVLRNAVSY